MSIRRAKKRAKMDFIRAMAKLGFQPKNSRWFLRQPQARDIFKIESQ